MIDRGEVIRKVILNSVRWTGLSRVYRAMKPCAGAILMLHRVTSASTSPLGFNRHLSIAPDFLDRLIGGLKADGYRFVTMDEMAARLKRGDLEGCPLALTADDAYRCFMRTEMDYLIIDNFLLAKTEQPAWEGTDDWKEEFELD